MKQPKAERDPLLAAMDDLGEKTAELNGKWYENILNLVREHWEGNEAWRQYPFPNPKPIIAQALANAVLMINDEAIGNIGPRLWQSTLNEIQEQRAGHEEIQRTLREIAEKKKSGGNEQPT